MGFRKLKPFDKPLDAVILVVLVAALTFVGYELGLGFAGLWGAVIAVGIALIQQLRSRRRHN
jgi:small basic protein